MPPMFHTNIRPPILDGVYSKSQSHELEVAQPVYWLAYGLDDQGIVVRFPVDAIYFAAIQIVQTELGAHPVSYWTGMGGRG
jgi:hypothetical protein